MNATIAARSCTVPIAITLMRHGRSRADDECVHEGRYDSPLTMEGQAQVRRRAAEWAGAGVRFASIVSSPLVRARESAGIVADALGGNVREDSDWLERDNGRLAGLSFAEALAKYPPPISPTPYDRAGETGETIVELHARAARAMQSVVAAGESPVLVVAHGGILNAALRVVLGIPLPMGHSGASFAFRDAGYIRLRYDPATNAWAIVEFVPGESTL